MFHKKIIFNIEFDLIKYIFSSEVIVILSGNIIIRITLFQKLDIHLDI